jgi:hypothetical protein
MDVIIPCPPVQAWNDSANHFPEGFSTNGGENQMK